MFDIVPPSSPPSSPKPRVLKLKWQLPARLRRPVRQELSRQKIKQEREKAVKRFEKEPLFTVKELSVPPAPRKALRATGLRGASPPAPRSAVTPHLNISLPPYRGGFVRSQQKARSFPLPAPRKALRATGPSGKQSLVVFGERDVPYTPSSPAPSSSRKISLPVRLSIFPSVQSLTDAKTTRHLVLFAVACLLSSVIFFNIKHASQGYAVLDSVQAKAREAYERVGVAQAAFAATNFEDGEKQFADAAELLRQAKTEFEQALDSSRLVLRFLDITGTVRSGEELLRAGEELTVAGQHLSRSLSPLFQSRLLAAESSPPSSSPSLTLVDALQQAEPEMAQAEASLRIAHKSLNAVSTENLPATIQPTIDALKKSLPRLIAVVATFQEQNHMLLEVLGAKRDKQYLLVFQNNHELRPTGGFIGSIALVNMDRGVVENIDVHSVYDPDGQLSEVIAPPDPLLAITPRWYLRDANWFIDYEQSAKKIASFLEKERGPTVDGVIALTPEVIRELLTVTGPIPLPAYGVTVTADNFVSLTQREVTYEYDRTLNKPKQFLADLTPLLLNKLFSTPSASSWQSLGILSRMVREKHILVYFRDEALQQQIRTAGWAGKLPAAAPGLISVNNANIGGHKSDQFIEQEIDYRLEVKADGTEATITIRRAHRGPESAQDQTFPPGENPAFKDNQVYQRVLVPKGSQLLDASGFTPAADIPRHTLNEESINVQVDADSAEWQRQQQRHESGTAIGTEAGYTFFANWIVTKPGQTTVTLYRFRLPESPPTPSIVNMFERYLVHVVKQPGDMHTTVRVELRLPATYQIVHTVPSDGVTQEANNTVIYRGELREDSVVGAVYSKS